ncbi:MAG: IS66 family transposase [Oligoflexus sp.]|nr:IS66 family transposase [Oligoflexus sp.]
MTIEKINITETIKNVEATLRDDKSISPQVRVMMELLLVVINLLLTKLGLNSKNSSIPPSKDPKRTRGSKRKTEGEKRKPGGQNGHEGNTLTKVAQPDHVETLEIDRRTIPSGKYTPVGFESRQVIDINISSQVTEYRAQILKDENGKLFVAKFPAGVNRPIQYGASIKAHAVYMSQQQLIPYDRIRDYFSDQCGIPLSAGSIFNFNKEAYILLETFEAIVKRELIAQGVLNVDETGINVNGKLLWLHTAGNDLWTMFFPHEKRGLKAMVAMGVLENFRGVLCHDHWKPYFNFKCLHALCNAHHLRELERAWEHDKQIWAKKMQALLLEINEAVDKAGGCVTDKVAKSFRSRYRNVLTRGDLECPAPTTKVDSSKRGRIAKSKSRNLLERLRNFETETLRFMTNKIVPFTNNQGENDIRMTKVQQKISGCFRSFEGAQIFCRVRSYLSTCRKHGITPTKALETLFSGRLPDFLVKLE